jgi:hypothetical protein
MNRLTRPRAQTAVGSAAQPGLLMIECFAIRII